VTPSPLSDSAIGDLRAACSALASKRSPLSQSDLAMVHGRINVAVDEMQACGTSCEHVVIAINAVATDSGLRWNDAPLFQRLITWGIERFYSRLEAHERRH
jgi:hypothetical protein